MNILLQTLKDNLKPSELTGLDKVNYPCLYPESKQAKNNKGNRCWECMPCCYWNLFIFFNQRCIEALVKSKRQSLDAIKRRMQAASKHKDSSDAETKSPALFKVNGSLGKFASLELSRFHCFALPLPSFDRFLFPTTIISACQSPSLSPFLPSSTLPFSILPPVWYLSLSALSSLPCIHLSALSVVLPAFILVFFYFRVSPSSCLFPLFHFLAFLASFIPGGYCFRDPINSNEAKFG